MDQDKSKLYAYPGQDQCQVVMPNQGFVAATPPQPFSPCALVTSIFGLICCPLFGTPSVIYAVMAYVEHRTGQFGRHKYFTKPAYAFGITAIVLGLIITAAVVAVYVVLLNQLMKVQRDGGNYGRRFDW